LLALAALLGGLTLIAAIGAAPASANLTNSCHIPSEPTHNFSVISLHERGLGCERARELTVHLFNKGTPEPYHCSYHVHDIPHYVTVTCRNHDESHIFQPYGYFH
jgi:hypothetical protein